MCYDSVEKAVVPFLSPKFTVVPPCSADKLLVRKKVKEMFSVHGVHMVVGRFC